MLHSQRCPVGPRVKPEHDGEGETSGEEKTENAAARRAAAYAASFVQLAPPASVSRKASPQAFASVRTRRI